MATNGFVQVDPNSTGLKIDTEDLTIGANEVQRQRMVLVPGTLPQGCSVAHAVSAASTNATSVKASPGQVYGWRIFNNAGYPVYIKLHNTAGAVTAGSGVVQTIGLQAGQSDSETIPMGLAFSSGIGLSIVKGIADNDATAVALNDVSVDLFYA